ncbi:hypothetical protein [Desulfosarcina variabilis]|uniref:hypothetical protein n=1 Tax=Desulfosarcina variabilis TaxID=2300 RepID=UPI003AFAC3D7
MIDNLSPIGEVLPKNESQARPLTRIDAFSQRRVWRDFLETGQTLTAVNIKKFVSAHLGEQKTKDGLSRGHQHRLPKSRACDALSDPHCAK